MADIPASEIGINIRSELKMAAPVEPKYTSEMIVRPLKATLVYENPLVIQQLPTDVKRIGPFATVGKFEESNNKRPFAQLTEAHGRAVVDTRYRGKGFFGRQENPIGDIDWKGNVMDNPVIELVDGEYRVRGFKDGIGYYSIAKASKLFPELGLPTEEIIREYKVDEIHKPDGTVVSIEYWKKEQLEIARSKGFDMSKVNILLGGNFYVYERGVQIAERLRDLIVANDEVTFKQRLEYVFSKINSYSDTYHQGTVSGTPAPEHFDINNPADIDRYLQYVSYQMGRYASRLRKNGIAHGYLHDQNWSAMASAYDLDSVVGKQINGEDPSEQDYIQDIHKTLGSVQALYEGTSAFRKFGVVDDEPPMEYKGEIAFLRGWVEESAPEVFDTTVDVSTRFQRLQELYQENFQDVGLAISAYAGQVEQKVNFVNVWWKFTSDTLGVQYPLPFRDPGNPDSTIADNLSNIRKLKATPITV